MLFQDEFGCQSSTFISRTGFCLYPFSSLNGPCRANRQTDRQTDRAIEGFIFTIPYSLFSMEFFMTDVGIVEVFAKESELPFIAF